MVSCPKCGYSNELGRIFCHKCGVKLDLEEVRPPAARGVQARGPGWSAKRIVGLAVRLVVLVGVVVMVALVLQVPPSGESNPGKRDVQGIEYKRLELERMIQQKKAGTIMLSDGEINSYIEQIITAPGARNLILVPTTVQVELGNGDVKVVVIGEVKFGESLKKQLAFSYIGLPMIEGNRFIFRPTGGSIGRLPIHPIILRYTGLLDRYYAQLFGSLSGDRELLNALASISVDSKRGVELKYDPTSRS